MAHQLGGLYDLPHGVCNAVLLPHVQSFNASVSAKRLSDVGRALGADINGNSPEEGAQAAIAAIRTLSQDVDIPAGLRELGAKLQDIPLLATNALKDACGLTNPRRADQRQIEEISAARSDPTGSRRHTHMRRPPRPRTTAPTAMPADSLAGLPHHRSMPLSTDA